MPFKDTLLGLTSVSPSHAGISTIYNKPDRKGENQGFRFNAEKAKNIAFESPKIIKGNKFDIGIGK